MDPVQTARARLSAGEAVVAGVLSGTSADGIDVGLVRFPRATAGCPGAPELEYFATEPFADELADRLRAVLDGESLDLAALAALDRDLGRAFGRAARTVGERAGRVLDLVGSHGQTVYHHDGDAASGPATLQLGDGASVAEEAHAPAVTDFRRADIAAGGEGAPLSALVDEELFPGLPRPFAILNLGGMANLTFLGRRTLAFDTGPAGSLLDGLARRLLRRPFDDGGRAAAEGRPSPELLEVLGRHPFFARWPPKSTGRDTFGEPWVARLVEQAAVLQVPSADLLATAVLFVARTVAEAIERFLPEAPRELIVAGGGVHNRTLLRALEGHSACPVARSDAHGVDPDAREALVFAVLAARNLLGRPSTRPDVTGADGGRVLGALHPGRAFSS